MVAELDSAPMRKTSGGMRIETRPLHIEEWLDKLPYIDFQKTGTILHEAIQATNKESIKPATRLELVELYNRPYQYYLDSQIKTKQHALEQLEAEEGVLGDGGVVELAELAGHDLVVLRQLAEAELS